MTESAAKSAAKLQIVPLRTPEARVSALGIAKAIMRALEVGAIEPGARLRQSDIAAQFGCSLAPVREAFRILESQGAVVIEPMRGARVSHPHELSARETFIIRRALACVLIEEAAGRPNDPRTQAFVAVALSLPERAGEGDVEVFRLADREASRALVEAAAMPRTLQMIRSLSFGREPNHMRALAQPGVSDRLAALWAQAGAAVAAGDAAAARAAMEELFDVPYRAITGEELRPAPAPEGDPG